MATISEIQQLYIAYFGRPADPAGLDYWVSTGISTKDFAAAMYAQPEFQQANAGLPVIDQVNALYLNLFGRSGDTEGLLYWTQQINTGKLTLASIANDLIFAANNNPSAQSQLDKTALNNKTATAISYTGDVRETSASLLAYNPTSSTPWVTGPQFTSAVTYLAGVTQTAPTAAATQAAVDAMTAITPPGQTFTLTTGQDIQTAETFIGYVDFNGGTSQSSLSTMNSFDVLSGSSTRTTDSLNLQLQNANGQAIGGSPTAQVNTYTIGTVTANQKQVNQAVVTVGGTFAAGLITFTYGGLTSTAAIATDADTGAANLVSAVNSLANGTVAFIGKVIANTGTTTGSTALTSVSTTGLVVGMSVTGSGIPSGTTIAAIGTGAIVLSASATATATITATFGGGTAGVTVFAPSAGVVSGFGITGVTGVGNAVGTSLITPNITGNIGATVGFTYGTQQGSYVIGATQGDTALNLAAALNAVVGSGSAVVPSAAPTTVKLTAPTAGIPLLPVVFTGTSTNLPTGTTPTANATGSAISFGTNTGLDIVNLSNISGSDVTVSASGTPGATTFRSNLSTKGLVFNDLTLGSIAYLKGNGDLTTGGLTAGYGSTVTSGAVVLEGGTTAGAITINGSGLTSQTITSTGASNKVGAVTGAASATSTTIAATTNFEASSLAETGATLTVTGAGTAKLGTAISSEVKTLNAAANTGGVTAVLNTNVDITVTGGSGNDTITAGVVLTTGSVNAGAGLADELIVGTNVNYINTVDLASKYTNFEVLNFGGTYDMSLLPGITAIKLSAPSIVTNLTAIQAANTTAVSNLGNTSLALATSTGTTDVANIKFGIGGSKTNAATTAGALTVNGFETLNLVAAPGSTATVGTNRTTTIGSFGADKVTAINLTGTAFTLSDAATTKAVTIDASALTGNGVTTPVGLTIAGNLVAGSTVTGSTLKDVLTLGTVGSTYNGGNGDDDFTSTVALLLTGTTYNIINGGNGTDTLNIANSTTDVTLVDNTFKNITNVEKLVITSTGSSGTQSIVTGGFFNTNFAAGVTLTGTSGNVVTSYDLSSYTGPAIIGLSTAAATADTTVTTGTGNDIVAIAAVAVTSGDVTLSTGAGNDTLGITVSSLLTSGPITFNAGAGKDLITASGVDAADTPYIFFTIGAGDSTLTAFDEITGYATSVSSGALGMNLDFAGTATVATNVTSGAVTGYTSGELTYSITNGKLTFAGTSASSLSNTMIATIAAASVTTTTQTVGWSGIGGTGTFIFNDNTAGDSLVFLNGVTTFNGIQTTGDLADTGYVFVV